MDVDKMKKYQRFLTQGFTPFDPLELTKETEKLVTRRGPSGLERKYAGIYSAPVYGGIATGYAIGCCLRCVYCWSNWSRDFPEIYGDFYSPKEVARKLCKATENGITSPGWEKFRHLKIEKLRLSGCEPTMAREHLLSLLESVDKSKYKLFILETNGVLFGAYSDYVKKISKFLDKIYVRVSFKAATPEAFTLRTGAIGKYYEFPFKAYEYLLNEGIYARVAAMTDSTIMPREERKLLLEKLGEIDPIIARNPNELEEEQIDIYDTTSNRLKAFTNLKFAKELEKKILRYRL